jgi:class 3 adenylate cyclase
MEQKKVIIILADISGYTRFMLESKTSALHGQLVISGLIESILKEVDIPLTLQEIEGDAVFLYAAHPGSEDDWRAVAEQVSTKLERFFSAFIAESAVTIESTPCGCAICRNSAKLGLKIIVHTGEAVFHAIAGRSQVSGPDVILAHRLLKNAMTSDYYLLLTDAAYAAMGDHLPETFETHQETYEGFGTVNLRVRVLDEDMLLARDALYKLPEGELRSAVDKFAKTMGPRRGLSGAIQQLRQPIRRFTWHERVLMIWESVVAGLMANLYFRRAIPGQMIARGKRRTSWNGPN